MAMRPIWISFCLILPALSSSQAESGSPPQAVVVCPDQLRIDLSPLVEHRRRQGFQIDLVESSGSAETIRNRIRSRLGDSGRRFILLVGDASLPWVQEKNDQSGGEAANSLIVPTHHDTAEVNLLWGSPPHIATDNWYADLDGDRIPDAAVGRLTADSPAQLQTIVKKIIDYEQCADFGPWRGRLDFVAGVGGFGFVADTVIETAARYFLTTGIPSAYDVRMTQGSWRSPYCPDPRLFNRAALAGLNDGAAFWIYIGHGHFHQLDRVRLPGADYHIFDVADAARLKSAHGLPIAVFLSCYAGAFDVGDANTPDCLAEEMLRTPGGPVAVVAASRVAMPYAMAVLATGMMDEFFRGREETLGEVFLAAKRRMVAQNSSDQNRKKLDSLAAAVSPAPDKLDAERAEHLSLFNIIGDPMLRLRRPQTVAIDVPATFTSGGVLEISAKSPVAGRATVELAVRRDRFVESPPQRAKCPAKIDELAALESVYRRANDRRLNSVELTVPAAEFKTQINVPPNASGQCHVKIFVQGEKDFALGSADVIIKN